MYVIFSGMALMSNIALFAKLQMSLAEKIGSNRVRYECFIWFSIFNI